MIISQFKKHPRLLKIGIREYASIQAGPKMSSEIACGGSWFRMPRESRWGDVVSMELIYFINPWHIGHTKGAVS